MQNEVDELMFDKNSLLDKIKRLEQKMNNL